jgi:hypothetical protein
VISKPMKTTHFDSDMYHVLYFGVLNRSSFGGVSLCIHTYARIQSPHYTHNKIDISILNAPYRACLSVCLSRMDSFRFHCIYTNFYTHARMYLADASTLKLTHFLDTGGYEEANSNFVLAKTGDTAGSLGASRRFYDVICT